jgi:methyl-accepting chemotaxis protein
MIFYQFTELPDKVVFHSDNWPASMSARNLTHSTDATLNFHTILANGKLWRVGAGGNATRSMIMGLDLDPAVTLGKQVASAFSLSIPVALVLIALGAVFMARRALRPVHDLTRLVERVTARGLSERVESRVKDAEFEKLILVFNQMMDRLERSFLFADQDADEPRRSSLARA